MQTNDQSLSVLKLSATAIMYINSLTTSSKPHEANQHGLTVGHDLAVAGFDGIADAEHTSPPLTTLNQPLYDIARNLVKMLVAIIHDESLENRRMQLKPELLIRESTGG